MDPKIYKTWIYDSRPINLAAFYYFMTVLLCSFNQYKNFRNLTTDKLIRFAKHRWIYNNLTWTLWKLHSSIDLIETYVFCTKKNMKFSVRFGLIVVENFLFEHDMDKQGPVKRFLNLLSYNIYVFSLLKGYCNFRTNVFDSEQRHERNNWWYGVQRHAPWWQDLLLNGTLYFQYRCL